VLVVYPSEVMSVELPRSCRRFLSVPGGESKGAASPKMSDVRAAAFIMAVIDGSSSCRIWPIAQLFTSFCRGRRDCNRYEVSDQTVC
jgi:hypothetical protein